MDGVYETENTATVDLSKVGKVTNNGGGNACGGFVEFNAPQGTIAISKPNTKALKAWATAPKKGPGIDPGRIKVYLRKTAADYPKWDPETAASLGPALAALWRPPEGTTPLKASLANEIGEGLSLLYSSSDIQPRVEKAGGQDIDINGASDKNGAEELYKFLTLQYPVSHYKNKTPVSWTPDISATVTPSYFGSWNDESGKIQFEIDGENFCKSSLMIINPNSDFGYWYNNTVTSLPTLTTNGKGNWSSFSSAKKGPLIEWIVGSLNGNVPPTQIWSEQSNGVYAKVSLNFDTTSYGSFAFRYDIGNSFAGNTFASKVLPDGMDFALPAGRAGLFVYEQVAPFIDPLLAELGIGAGFTDTSWKNGVDATKVDVLNTTAQEATNILLNLIDEVGTLFEARPDVQRNSPVQNSMQEQSAAPRDSNN
jgi:hypothetical protein